MDRLPAQIRGIKNVFPNSKIVYCLVHIRRDLVKNFGFDSLIVKGFDEITINYSACENYIQLLACEMDKLRNSEMNGWRALQELIEQHQHWLPIDLISQGINIKFSSSRIENLFGLYKQNYGNTPSSLISTINKLAIYQIY